MLVNAPRESTQGFHAPPSAMKTSGLCSAGVVADGTFSSCYVESCGLTVPDINGTFTFFPLKKEMRFRWPPFFVLYHLPPK